MLVQLHLVSMPWADIYVPSVQLGALKAHVERELPTLRSVHTYSAFSSIFLDAAQTELYTELLEFRELPYFFLTRSRFVEGAQSSVTTASLVAGLAEGQRGGAVLTEEQLERLGAATDAYIEQQLGPNLVADGVNLVGFTLNYNQVYASIYCALQLRTRFPAHRFVFVFGGASASTPAVAQVLRRLGIHGFGVLGEGEVKLETIVSMVADAHADDLERLAVDIPNEVPGVYDIQTHEVDLFMRDEESFATQFRSIGGLPIPEVDEYFEGVQRAFKDTPAAHRYRANIQMPLEGSRGCFANCDFCGINVNWQGFRRRSADDVVDDVVTAVARYRVRRILFMDNVCDTWAEKYADEMIRRRIRVSAMMELRAHHPQRFWTKLSLAGVDSIQVGIEALAPSLIRSMSKGTKSWQNILVQKWLRELGIESCSNLITGHPRSTFEDIEHTKSVIERTPHFGRYSLSSYTLAYGSPLYEEVPRADRPSLRVDTYTPQLAEVRDMLVPYYGYIPPKEWYPDGLMRAWRDFVSWYESHLGDPKHDPTMIAHRIDDERIVIVDGRTAEVKEVELIGEQARVYEACHRGLHRRGLAALDIPVVRAQAIVTNLVDQGVALESDGCYIALALRPRDELVHELRLGSPDKAAVARPPHANEAPKVRLRVM